MLRHSVVALMLWLSLAAAGTASAQSQNQSRASGGTAPAQAANQTQTQAPAAGKNDYGNGDSWLCRPGRQDACAVDLSTTVVAADGKLKRETWAAHPSAPIDCFYVYP